jgi:tRNA threonylcarbamoyladenosine biosynthesis protein TsaB
VLAFDTATAATAVAVCDIPPPGDVELEARDDPAAGHRPAHVQRLLPLVLQLVQRAGGWQVVDRLAVGVGPGTFTGLRIGIATAHGLACARGLELVGVSTLRALALSASRSAEYDGRGVIALLDARRGELFAAGWAPGCDPLADEPLIAPCALAPVRVCELLGGLGESPIAVGDGAILFAEMLRGAGATVPTGAGDLHRVSARAHCLLAANAVPGALEHVQPEYARLPDAELARRSTART